MSMSAMIQAMGAVAGGVSSGMDAAEAAAERKRKRDADIEDRAFTMSERTRAVNMRQDMGNAAAEVVPVELKQDRPETMDNRDVGQPGEEPLPTAGYDVAGKRFTDRTQAAAAATEQNTPQAVTARMANVEMRNGEPVKAQQLRTGAMQEQTAKYQLNGDERADIDAKFNADLQTSVTNWDGLDKFVSDSAGDGQGGQIKIKSVVSADGKTRVVNVVGPDGKLHPTEKVVPNTPDGLALATAELARMPADKKLAHLHQKAMLAQQATRDASTAEYHSGMLKETQNRTAANIEIAQIRTDAAAARRGVDAPAGIEPFDAKLARDTAHDSVRAENKRRGDANQSLLTGNEAASLVDESVGAQQSSYGNRMLMSAAANELGPLRADSPKYAETYARVLAKGDAKAIGAKLVSMGFVPPTSSGRPATEGAPSAPVTMIKATNQAGLPRGPSTPNLDPRLTGDQQGAARREVMSARIPDAQKTFDDAKAVFESAKAKGPMYAEQARYALNKARVDLAEAKAKAGK